MKNDVQLFAPEFLIEEFRKYKLLLKKKTKRSDEDFEAFFELLERKITFVPKEELAAFLPKARKISPDPKDVPYIAVALQRKMPIWSNDVALKNQQKTVHVYNTEDLLRR